MAPQEMTAAAGSVTICGDIHSSGRLPQSPHKRNEQALRFAMI